MYTCTYYMCTFSSYPVVITTCGHTCIINVYDVHEIYVPGTVLVLVCQCQYMYDVCMYVCHVHDVVRSTFSKTHDTFMTCSTHLHECMSCTHDMYMSIVMYVCMSCMYIIKKYLFIVCTCAHTHTSCMYVVMYNTTCTRVSNSVIHVSVIYNKK